MMGAAAHEEHEPGPDLTGGFTAGLAHGLTSAQKAAVIIAALEPDQSAEMLRSFDRANLQAFARAMTQLSAVPRAALEMTISEFLGTLSNQFLGAGSREVTTILTRIMNAEDAERLVNEVQGGPARSVWEELSTCPDAEVVDFLQRQHPQAAAAILARAGSSHAARLIGRMEPAVAREAVSRLARVGEIGDDAIALLEQSLRDDLIIPLGRAGDKVEPDAMIGAILDSMSGDSRAPILKDLEEERPEFAAAVQKKMFTFEDIPARVSVRQMPTIARVVPNNALRSALAHGRARGSQTVDFILSNISKRLAEQITEELDEGLTVKPQEGEEAQAEIVSAIRALAESGEIELILPD